MSKPATVLSSVHLLIDCNLGQDYVFDGCMAYVMECLGESGAYDYWFFAGVSGDIYTQVYSRRLDRGVPDLSHAGFDQVLADRVFGAAGYGCTFVCGCALGADLQRYRAAVVASIDRGVPVIAKGFDFTMDDRTYPNVDIGCIVGYEGAGETLLYVSQDSVTPSPHMAQDPITPRPFVLSPSYSLLFAGEKRQAPPLADVYRQAIRRIAELNRMPERDGVSFGTQAFTDWADDIEAGRFDALPLEAIDFWPHYAGYLVNVLTNIYGQHFTQRAIEACPDLTSASEIRRLYQEMAEVGDFGAVGGNFDMDPSRLKDREHMRPICTLIRKLAAYNEKIVEAAIRA